MTLQSLAIQPALARAWVELRPAVPADAEACGRILHLAFRRLHESRGFAPDFPSVEVATDLVRAQIANPDIFAVVAAIGDSVVGSNFLTEGDPIRGVGPISVHPDHQGAGVGRMLMQAVIARGAGGRGVRLVQDAFNGISMALYASLGFDAREPLALLAGRPKSLPVPGWTARPMGRADLAAADALCRRVHDFPRSADLRNAVAQGTAVVAIRDGRITGYMSAPHFWILNHAAAETEGDLKALILGAAAAGDGPLSFLMPIRRAELFRWCLEQDLRVIKPMTLMTRGHYAPPNGGYLPSVFY